MATRILTRRAAAGLRTTVSTTKTCPSRSLATAAQTSNLPNDVQKAIKHEASLLTPDPPADSQTARLVMDQMPYMVPTYVRPPPMFAKGEGCYMFDVENRQYLDFTAGIAVNALGHSDPDIASILHAQALTLIHSSNLYHNPWTGALSKHLVDTTLASGGMRTAAKAFICNSGSEANEAAIKFARKCGSSVHERKTDLVSFQGSFHGRTMGSLSATPNPKYQKPFAPMLPGFKYGAFNDVEALEHSIDENTCGVMVEPIQGEGGINVATPEFLAALRRRCDEVGAVLIFDEIQSGLMRSGALWAHACNDAHNLKDGSCTAQHCCRDAQPDVLCTAKALGNGFPIGATIVSDKVAEKIVTGDHGTTFGGNPLGCRVAHHILGRLAAPEMQRGVIAKEKVFRKGFEELKLKFPEQIVEVRGRGLILGLQLSADPTPIVTAARERGLLVITCGTNTLRFVPPLVISEQQIEDGMGILEQAMESVFHKGEHVRGTPGQQEMGDKGQERMATSASAR